MTNPQHNERDTLEIHRSRAAASALARVEAQTPNVEDADAKTDAGANEPS